MASRTDIELELESYSRILLKPIARLEYSYNKVQKLPTSAKFLDDETLEIWESFSSRFSRVVDLFLTKYLRARVLKDDPGFQGSLRDFVDQGEKLGILDNADSWMQRRGLRNIAAHEYTEDSLEKFFRDLKAHSPHLLSIKVKI